MGAWTRCELLNAAALNVFLRSLSPVASGGDFSLTLSSAAEELHQAVATPSLYRGEDSWNRRRNLYGSTAAKNLPCKSENLLPVPGVAKSLVK